MEPVLISSLSTEVQQFINENADEYNPNGNNAIDSDEIGKLLAHYNASDIGQLSEISTGAIVDYSQYPETLKKSLLEKLEKEKAQLEEDLIAYEYDLQHRTMNKIDNDTMKKCTIGMAKAAGCPACIAIGFGAIDFLTGKPNLLKAYGKYACGLLVGAAIVGVGALLGRGLGAIANHWRKDSTPYLKKVPSIVEDIKQRLAKINLEIKALKK